MDEIEKLVEEILKHDKKDFAAALQKKAKAYYQVIFNDGHASATGTNATKLEAAEARATEAEKTLKDTKKEFEKFKKETPDTATLNSEWQGKLDKAKQEFEDYKAEVANEKKAEKRKTAVSKVAKYLTEYVDDDFADALAERPTHQERISFDEAGNLRVLQPGSQIPFAGDENAQLKALAEEIGHSIKAANRRSSAKPGSGRSNTSGGGGNKTNWDAIREKAKTAVAGSTDGITDRQAALDKRMGKATRV